MHAVLNYPSCSYQNTSVPKNQFILKYYSYLVDSLNFVAKFIGRTASDWFNLRLHCMTESVEDTEAISAVVNRFTTCRSI